MSDYDDKQVKETTNLTEREETQLPQWAQERLADLRVKANQLKQENLGLKAQDGAAPEESAVSYGDVENDPSYLPDGSFDAIRYTIKGGHLDVRLKDDTLELAGSDDLSFVPQATNVIRIGLRS